MNAVSLVVSNFRCFTDSKPLTIPLSQGSIGIVGKNNSGKSSALRLIHELRPVWDMFRGSNNPYLTGGHGHPGCRDVQDSDDIRCDRNDRDMQFKLVCSEPIAGDFEAVAEVRMIWSRTTSIWTGEFFRKSGEAVTGFGGIDGNRRLIATQSGHFDIDWVLSTFERLVQAQYIPPYRNIVHSGGAAQFGIQIGQQFVEQWRSHKVGGPKLGAQAAVQTQNMIAEIFGFDSLEINATTQNDLQLVIDGRPYRIGEVGHGVAQFILTVVNLLFIKPKLVLIDEPETGLHPMLQRTYLSLISKITGGDVFFATHSVGLARTFAEKVLVTKKHSDGVEVYPLESLRNYSELLGELSFSSWREIGGRSVLLVEGVTDVKAIVQILRLLKKDQEVIVLPMGGRELIKAGTGQEIGEISRLSVSVHVLIDSEKTSADALLANSREKFVADCAKHGVKAHVLSKRALENYWPDATIKRAVDSKARALTEFEDVKNSGCGWGKSQNAKIAYQLGLGDLNGTDLLSFLQSL